MESLLALGLLGVLAAVGWSLTDRSRNRPRTARLPAAPPEWLDPELDPGSGTGVAREHQVADDRTSAGPASPPPLATWGSLLAAPCLRAKIQLAYALQWLAIESGGNPCEVGDPRAHGPDGFPRELGIAQFYNPDDLARLHATSAQLRAYCVPGDQHAQVYRGKVVRGFSKAIQRPLDPAEMDQQASMAVALIARCMAAATKDLTAVHAGPAWGPDRRDYWTLVKLQHGLPGISRSGLPAVTRKLGRPPRDWKEFRDTLGKVTLDAQTEKYRAQFPAILDNAERCASVFAGPGVV